MKQITVVIPLISVINGARASMGEDGSKTKVFTIEKNGKLSTERPAANEFFSLTD